MLIALIVATEIVFAVLYFLGKPLESTSARYGIVSFQIAGNLEQSQKILAAWDGLDQQEQNAHPTRRIYAAFNLGLDFLFLVLYSNTIALACIAAANVTEKRHYPPVCVSIGLILAWGQWLAALLDATENTALFVQLLGSQQNLWPHLALWCAIPKFSLVALGILYVVIGIFSSVAMENI